VEATGDAFRVGRRDLLFSAPYLKNNRWAEFDIMPNDSQFIFVKPGKSTARPIVVLNFFESLRRRGGER